jgi:hypothetical protein
MVSRRIKEQEKNIFKSKSTAVSQIIIVCGGRIERMERKHSSSNCA